MCARRITGLKAISACASCHVNRDCALSLLAKPVQSGSHRIGPGSYYEAGRHIGDLSRSKEEACFPRIGFYITLKAALW